MGCLAENSRAWYYNYTFVPELGPIIPDNCSLSLKPTFPDATTDTLRGTQAGLGTCLAKCKEAGGNYVMIDPLLETPCVCSTQAFIGDITNRCKAGNVLVY